MISDEEVRTSFRQKLNAPDVFSSLFKMKTRGQNTGYRLNSSISLQIARGLKPDLWKDAPKAGCFRHMAIFNEFHVVPKYCFDCYKVVIAPRTIVELFKLLLMYDKLTLPNNNTRKCMIDGRSGSTAVYKGFIYCRGLEEGKEVQELARIAVAEHIGPGIEINLKRGCTEYAQAYPDYARIDESSEPMKYGDDWQFYEDFADENFVFDNINPPGDDKQRPESMHELFALQFWVRYAATIGDTSYLTLTGGKTVDPLPQQQ